MTIKTNNQPRPLKCLFEFSLKEQELIKREFDWLEDIESDRSFFHYRGLIYHLEEFLRVTTGSDDATQGWDGYAGDSYFSGTLVKLCSDSDYVVVGRWFS
jgi:hypothetical protein